MVHKPARNPQRRPIPPRPRPAMRKTRASGTALLLGFLAAFGVTIGLIARMGPRPAARPTEISHASVEPRAAAKTEPQAPSPVAPKAADTDPVDSEDVEWAAEMREAAERKRLAAEQAEREEARRAEEEAARVRAAEQAQARVEDERRGFPRLLAEVEILVGSHQYGKALSRIDEIVAGLTSDELLASLAPYREEAERAARLLDTFVRQARVGGLGDPANALGTGMQVAGADADQVHLEAKGVRASIRWRNLTTAQLFDLLRRSRLDATGRYDLACFAIDGSPRDLGEPAARILFSLSSAGDARAKADIDRAMARLRGMPELPEGGFVAHGGRLVTVAERDNLKRGLVEFLGSWMTPVDRRHRERGEFPVTLASGDVRWVKEAKELEKLGLIYYAKRDRWFTPAEYARLRLDWDDAFETETAHYHLRTNISEEFLARIGRILEEAYGVYRERLGMEPQGGEKPWIYLFRSREDYERYCLASKDKGYDKHLSSGGFADAARRFGCGYGIDGHEAVLVETTLHEGAHLFFGLATAYVVPSWYAEGTATAFECYVWDDAKGTLDVTPFNRSMARRLKQDIAAGTALSLSAVLAGDAHEANDGGMESSQRFYSAAWGLYYYLHHAESPLVSEGLKKLEAAQTSGEFSGSAASASAMFQEAFGDPVAFEEGWRAFILALPVEP